jgi:hypothetical protein
MSQIIINGKTFQGNSVIINNGKIIIDGKEAQMPDDRIIQITVQGNIEKLDVDACNKIEVTGNTGSIKTINGDIRVLGDVNGSIQTMSGDVNCGGKVSGSINTMSGDIKHK